MCSANVFSSRTTTGSPTCRCRNDCRPISPPSSRGCATPSAGCADVWGSRMTAPLVPDLVALATPYALHATTDAERADIERQIAEAPAEVAEAFFAQGRAVHETMAIISAATGADPPLSMRERLLATVAQDTVQQLPSKRANR